MKTLYDGSADKAICLLLAKPSDQDPYRFPLCLQNTFLYLDKANLVKARFFY